ncbi:hypothetical protein [Botrimarina sp.]|uniref:hypothetical protein n=1 Tax=Botrimarina sp. TaxID=2795802 RepID=UPI0032EF88E4
MSFASSAESLRVAAACLVASAVLGPGLGERAAAAEFWLSLSDVVSPGPEAPSIAPKEGVVTTFRVWGRPTAGRQFTAVSLDVVASATGVEFVDGTYTFFNDAEPGTQRFEFTRDSASTPPLLSDVPPPVVAIGAVDALRGVNAFTLEPAPGVRGPGPYCAATETGCVAAGDGQPAWLLAEFDLAALAAGAMVDLHLQLGDRGVVERTLAPGDYAMEGAVDSADYVVWASAYGDVFAPADGNADGLVDGADYTVWRDHLGEVAVEGVLADTDVRFGVDAGAGSEPLYDAEDPLDRGVTLPGDDPDAQVVVAAPAVAVPEPASVAGAVGLVCVGLISNGRRGPTRHREFLRMTNDQRWSVVGG